MYLPYYLRVQALVGLAYGLASVFLPSFMLRLHGLPVADPSIYLSTMLGGLTIGASYTAWLIRDTEISKARQAFLIGILIQNTVILVCTTRALVNELVNEWAWLIIALGIVLTIWCFFYVIVREDRPEYEINYFENE